ncbi:MAG TPA: hypothetical protein VK211_24330 [Kamptonema sp.]|nr:hypothetical protein [Kamptonema sp.]
MRANGPNIGRDQLGSKKNTPYDDNCEVIELIEYRTYDIEGETTNPEVVFHFEIPDWKARGLTVVSQNGIFVQTVYK